MKKKGNTTPPKVYYPSIIEYKDTKKVEMPDKEFKISYVMIKLVSLHGCKDS
jgi:hypothetical protein